MTDATDDFNRASLGTNWTVSLGTPAIVSSTVIGGAAGDNVCRWNLNTFPSDQYAQLTLTTDADGGGPIVRHQAVDATFYELYTSDSGQLYIFEVTVHSWAMLGATYTNDLANGNTLKIDATGSTLTPYANGTPLATRSDASITGGYPGVHLYNGTVRFDNWVAGPIVVTGLFARPSADDTDGGWTDSSAGTNLYAQLDETSASDADFIRSANSPSSDTCKIHLSDPAANVTTPINLKVRYAKGGTGTINLTVKLFEGTTELWSKAYNDISASFTTATETAITLNQPISDETNLYVQFIATAA